MRLHFDTADYGRFGRYTVRAGIWRHGVMVRIKSPAGVRAKHRIKAKMMLRAWVRKLKHDVQPMRRSRSQTRGACRR